MPGDLLKKYKTMRDFGDTPEPAGGKPIRGKRPIFVIQKHQASHLHYDFRLEMEGVLKSWAVPKGPSYDPSVKRLAMMTEDHPYDYAAFEGVIPDGNYGAGNVIIWDQGTWELIGPGDDPVKALESGDLKFRLYGKKMFGEWALFRIKGRSPKGKRVAARQASRQVRERQSRRDGSRAEVRRVEQNARGCRREQDLAEQSTGDENCEEGRRYFEEETSCRTTSSSFLSLSKLARSIASESSTHSTSSTSLSCGVNSPAR